MSWDFLHPLERYNLSVAHSAFLSYAKLRKAASTADLSPLLAQRPAPDDSPIDNKRVLLMGCALLRFNLNFGDLIRWLGGPYTNAHRDWSATFAHLETVRHCLPPSGFPTPDYTRTFRACTEGVPLQANYISSYDCCSLRNSAKLSSDLVTHADDVTETLRKEEKQSYHILLPRFLWRFLPGIFLSIFRVAYRYGDPKPRLCVDPTTTLSADDIGNVNRFLPSPGINQDENPSIYYGTAFLRYLIWIWNLRISYPDEDILQMTDDISAAFHRVLYHPDISIAFSAVWLGYLVVAIGMIFGAVPSPAFYMLLGEMRAHLAQHMLLPTPLPQLPLVQHLILPPPPTPHEVAAFGQAVRDSLNQGILFATSDFPERRMPPYVDDTGNAHVRRHFITAVTASLLAAYIMFGFPDEDPNRPPCINPKKWNNQVSWHVTFLGYHIDSRLMRVAWPLDKRKKLAFFLDQLLGPQLQGKPSSPKTIARVLGIIRHAALVTPYGNFRSLQLQHYFNDQLRRIDSSEPIRRWYLHNSIRLPKAIRDELLLFRSKISDKLHDPFWSCPIGLLVPRVPTLTVCTDASLQGLGGWSPISHLNHMWRITLNDLHLCGLKQTSRWHSRSNYLEPDIDQPEAHINVLEFFAIFIELWVVLRQIHLAQSSRDPLPAECIPPGGHRLEALTDNTCALSWLRYATRTRRTPIRQIARLLSGFLSHPFASDIIRVQAHHIAGVDNVEADHLSRYEKSPSWESVMGNCTALQDLRICLLPPKLLSTIVSAFSNKPNGAWFEKATTKLWTIEPPVFVIGSSLPAGSLSSMSWNPSNTSKSPSS